MSEPAPNAPRTAPPEEAPRLFDEPAPEALARSEQAYRSLVKETSSLVWRWTPEGTHVEGPGWAFPPHYDGDAWLEWIHPDDRARAQQEWSQALAAVTPWRAEFRARTEGGEHRWCVARGVPLRDSAGLVTEWVGNLTDVHDERLAHEALQRKDKLEAVGRLTAGVAHDFNNLLTVITAGAEAIMDGLPGGHPLRSEAELTLHAAERGAELVNRLLTVARQQPLRPRALDAGQMLDALARLVRRTLGEDLELCVTHARGPLFCLADPAQLESAMLNLCINARDAMPGGGTVNLESGLVSFTEDAAPHFGLRPGPYVMLSVRDTGAGMSPETIRRAVEPFFTTKAVGRGSGLGLSMVYGFVRQSGGHFTISSIEGAGTTVRLYLPEAEPPEAATTPDAAEPAAGAASSHILLVEDDRLVRDQVARQLNALGHRVTAAADGRAALDALAGEETFALLMTDVVMPGGLNGRQLADQARLLRPALPVLFTSGYNDDAILREGRIGAQAAFLAKPYRRAQLAAALQAILEGTPSPPSGR
ncbi:PAS domain-containing hybrid sensor histidine kinase/response regulator [Phenylobacterium sp.]|jgi:signal transduction histidine kinase/ActR/RegA family two-component response regulator|uniref:PAS domain-containing hybrid sensor histidine kinase/response regulator n=1 Tax=Phenylobacterium sp. TaxID=1871053 RepID=UPI002E31482C|nr:ATP-binding protein [Phenylobacterium sp.]HEX3364392.1 ATP-binding protein [Phenylobacterium sp.]